MAFADDDLPGRVGRVADVGGELFLAPQDKPDQWVAIGLNYPVTSGDNLWVGKDGRAEIDFGAGQFRLAGDTNLHLSQLDDRQFAVFVAQGRVNVRVRVLEPGETARIDTPNTQVVLTRPGLYRVDVSDDREHTQLIVREGEANILTAGGVQQVLPGQTAAVDGTDPRYRDRAQRRRQRWLRYVGRRPRPPVLRTHGELRFAADGRRRGSRSIRDLEPGSRVRRGLVPVGRRRGLGAVSQRLLDRSGRLGTDMGRLCAVGLCAVPLRPLGLHRWPLGLVPGRLRRAAAVGAGAGRVGGRLRLEPVGDGRRTRLRLGPAGVGRAVPALVGTLLEWLLEPLQPAVCGECRGGAPEFTTDSLCQLERARRNHGGLRIGARDAAAGPGQSWSGSRAAWPRAHRYLPARRSYAASLAVFRCDGSGKARRRPLPRSIRPHARAGGAPGGIGAVPGGASAVAVPTMRTRPTAPTTASPPMRARAAFCDAGRRAGLRRWRCSHVSSSQPSGRRRCP